MTPKKLKELQEEPTTRTQIELSVEDHTAFKEYAKVNGYTLKGLMIRATKEFIKNKKGEL